MFKESKEIPVQRIKSDLAFCNWKEDSPEKVRSVVEVGHPGGLRHHLLEQLPARRRHLSPLLCKNHLFLLLSWFCCSCRLYWAFWHLWHDQLYEIGCTLCRISNNSLLWRRVMLRISLFLAIATCPMPQSPPFLEILASSMSCHAILSFLCNGDIFHDAVDSNTNLDPTILNLLHWDDDVLNLDKCNLDFQHNINNVD